MPPAFRSLKQNRYEMRPSYYLSAAFVTCLGVPLLALGLLFGGLAIFEGMNMFNHTPAALETSLSILAFALTLVGFSFMLSWGPVLLGTFAIVFALKWGRAGWGTAVIFGMVMGLMIALVLSEGDFQQLKDQLVILPIVLTGGFLGMVYWITCYRLAPRAFVEGPHK